MPCPRHPLHYSLGSATYSYADVRRNVIASADMLAQRIVHHPFKYESHRLGLEKSEDTLSWKVFRSLQEAGQLRRLAAAITGKSLDVEPLGKAIPMALRQDRSSLLQWRGGDGA